MLYLVTLPPPLHPGIWKVEDVDSERVAAMIRDASAVGKLVSRIQYRGTAELLDRLSGVELTVPSRKGSPPVMRTGDRLIQVKIRTNAERPGEHEVPKLADVQFLLITAP